MNVFQIFVFIAVAAVAAAKVEDNGIIGDPVVDCGDNYIQIHFQTQNPFKGLVFVEDYLTDPNCRSAAVENVEETGRNASLKLGFKGCGVERRRSQNPKGIFIVASLIVAFHPEFLTKIDRVYVVQCFYMEMEKIIEKEIQVKMKPPILQTENVPMPVCRYEVLDGSPDGPPLFYAVVGQMVYHKWSCDAVTENQFCMVVHSCYVDDGNGDRVQLINENGCAQDKHLLQNLDYISDLMVGKEAHVYKYADRQDMYFDCQITLTIKEPYQKRCDVPMCPEPPRRRRSEQIAQNSSLDDFSESESSFNDGTPLQRNFSDIFEIHPNEYILENRHLSSSKWLNLNEISAEICLSLLGLTSVVVLNMFMISISVILFCSAYRQIFDAKQPMSCR